MNPGLWADGWFYISAAGLLVSGVLFFFLLGQYRAAAAAAEDRAPSEAEAGTGELTVTPVYPAARPDAPEQTLASAPASEEKPPTPAPAASKEETRTEAPAERRRENTTGGISPAVVYLQNIKSQLEELQASVRGLVGRVDAISSRDEALIERLVDLAQAVADIKTSAPAPATEAPAPKRSRRPVPEPVPEPKTEPVAKAEPEPEPAPAAKAEARDPDKTVRLGPGIILPTPPQESAPEAAAPAEAAPPDPEPDDKPRRGPVWPV